MRFLVKVNIPVEAGNRAAKLRFIPRRLSHRRLIEFKFEPLDWFQLWE